jgi:plasmid stabilization system protein ParE
LLWGRSARQDLDRIADFYRDIDPDLPMRLMERIERAPLVLLDHPHLGERVYANVRRWRARGTPFLLFYALVGDDVQIRRVRHEAEDWRPRP